MKSYNQCIVSFQHAIIKLLVSTLPCFFIKEHNWICTECMYECIIMYKFKMAATCTNSCIFVLSTLNRPDVAVGNVSPRGEFKPLLFLHSWTTQGPESTCRSGNCRCFTEMYMTYVRLWSDFEKWSALHIFTH